MKNSSSKALPKGIKQVGNCFWVWTKVNGKRMKKSCGTDLSLAKLVLAEIKKQKAVAKVADDVAGLENLKQKKCQTTFAEAAEMYMAERPNLKASTLRGYHE